MATKVIQVLIVLCFMALLFWLAVWVITAIGIALPPHFTVIIGVICVLFALLFLIGIFTGRITWNNWF